MEVFKCTITTQSHHNTERLFSNKQSALKWAINFIKKNDWILWVLDNQQPFVDIDKVPDELNDQSEVENLEKALQPIVNISEVEVFD